MKHRIDTKIDNPSMKLILSTLFLFFYVATSSQETTAIGNRVNAFGLNFLATQNYQEESVVFSPYSIKTAFSMLLPAAKGETKRQIKEVLQFPKNDEDWFNFLRSTKTNSSFTIANALWKSPSAKIYQSYLDQISEFAEYSTLDFSNPETAAKEINQWFSNHSQGRVDKIFKREDLWGISVVIGNVIYLKPVWTSPFDSKDTYKDDFITLNNDKIACDFISKKDHIAEFHEDIKTKAIKLPFSNELSFLIVLPQYEYGEDLTSTIKFLQEENNFNMLTGQLSTGKIGKLSIPKFSLTSDINLKPILESMGMIDPFYSFADFSGMAKRGLFIDKAYHNTFFSIDEEGVEATSGTAIALKKSMPPNFICNRPFIYMVMDDKTGTALIMGIFSAPEK